MNDWTRTETTGSPSTLVIQYTNIRPDGTEEQKSVDLTSTTYGTSETIYAPINYTDRDGKPQVSEVSVKKTDTQITTIASVNPGYVAWRLTNDMGLPFGSARSENITTSEYSTTVDGPILVRETTEHYVSIAEFSGGLQLPAWGGFSPSGDEMILAHRTIREIELAKTAEGRDVTRTKTSRWIAAAESSEWKNYASKRGDDLKAGIEMFPEIVEPLVRQLIPLVYEGTEVQIETGRMPVAEKPSDQDLARDTVTNGRDLPSNATPTDAYGNGNGWPAFVPGGLSNGNFLAYLEDKDGDGEPDWKNYVPQEPSDYDQDSDSDGVPDWAPYVPDPANWEDFDQDSNGDGIQDWEEYVPVGDDFDTSDSDFRTDEAISNDKIITGIVLFNGQAFDPDNTTTTAAYDMPFAPDDYFAYAKGIPKLIRGNARAAAEAFGRMESALDVGHAYGQNIVTGWNETPTLDLSPVYVQVAGIEGAFLMDSTSYAWGPEGMVVSSDLMLLGVSGYYGTSAPSSSWLRLPVPVAGLQQVTAGTTGTASKANSIAIPVGFNARNPGAVLAALPSNGTDSYALFRSSQNLIGPTLELDQATLATGPALVAREFPYQLVVTPEVAVLATGPTVKQSTIIAPPAAGTSVAGLAPVVASGASVAIPVAAVSVAGLVPVVQSARIVEVPAAALTIGALVPEQVGRTRIEVLMPAGGVTVAALAPEVLTGAFVEVPAAVVTVAGLAPRVGGVVFWNSWAQQNYGWWPESYGDWWAN